MPDAWVVVLVSTLSAAPSPPAVPATAGVAATVQAVPAAPRVAYRHGERHFLTASVCEAAAEARPVPDGHRLVCLQYGAGEELMQAAAW